MDMTSMLAAATQDANPLSDQLQAAAFQARTLMRRHGLNPDKFGWDDSRRRAGQYWPDGSITLSRHLMAIWPQPEIDDTIRHEIAHALAPLDSNHGPAWRHACRITQPRHSAGRAHRCRRLRCSPA